LKNISQIGSSPQVGLNIKKYLSCHQPDKAHPGSRRINIQEPSPWALRDFWPAKHWPFRQRYPENTSS